MKILLHDRHHRGLSEPITLTIAGIASAIASANKYVNNNFGGWGGLKSKILSLIGRDPMTSPAKIEELKQSFIQPGGSGYNTNVGVDIRGVLDGSITNEALIAFMKRLEPAITVAKKGADKGDWRAARYVIVYGEFLTLATAKLQKRQDILTSSGASRGTIPGATQTPAMNKILLPAALILGLKLLF